MKKSFIAMSLVIAFMLVVIVSAGAFAAAGGAAQYIGEAKAKAIALEHAGVTEAAATFLKARLDHDDGRVTYDVEFYSGNIEYDYEIDAVDGRILESDKDIEYYAIPSGTSATTDAGQYIGEDKAKSIALENAGVTESQTTSIYAHLDRDDGRVDYDVKFWVGNTEYEYEIDATSGAILEFDRDTKDHASHGDSRTSNSSSQQTAANTGDYIGEVKAKSIALSGAGLSESQVTRMKVKLDRDDGRFTYEVDFHNGLMEYEYEIDAVSGAVLESDAEYDD